MKTNMTANDRRTIKARIAAKLEEAGYGVSGTDSPSLTLFTDRAVDATSKRIGNFPHGWITSGTIKTATAFLA